MKINNAIKQLQRRKSSFGDEENANSTAIRALQEWKLIREEAEWMDFSNRKEVINWVEKHIKAIERG